jgi:hypothetical protein
MSCRWFSSFGIHHHHHHHHHLYTSSSFGIQFSLLCVAWRAFSPLPLARIDASTRGGGGVHGKPHTLPTSGIRSSETFF